MPRYALTKIQDALNLHKKPVNGSRILVLGIAYKPDIDDLRESPALDVIHLLKEKGADIRYHDPYIPHLDHDNLKMDSVTHLLEEVKMSDCVAIITNHSDYDYPAILEAAPLIVDTRNALGKAGKESPKVVRL
jgi:UDP-N-acetyl-D-glucosamine dehydrogenase